MAPRLIRLPLLGCGLVLIAALVSGPGWWSYALAGLSLVFAAAAIYFILAKNALALNQGALQGAIQNLVLDHLEWDGRGHALDIGCGNGPLTIKLARLFPESHATGLDSWSGMRKYSVGTCRRNARDQEVLGRVDFERGDAANLPFEDETFEAVVSNLVFHEVKGARDKRPVVKEALRVLKKGGAFSFQDLFEIKTLYGDLDSLVAELQAEGAAEVEFMDTSRSFFIPSFLRMPFMLGRLGIIHGRK